MTAWCDGVLSRRDGREGICTCGRRGQVTTKGRMVRHADRGIVMTNASTVRHVPNKPPMVMRSFRVPLPLWDAAQAKCAERQENISDVIREALERYVRRQ